ncbi:MAG TPA: 4'-phosphopantetheinyl transferase superfamily protein [Opitutaceae bacterium]
MSGVDEDSWPSCAVPPPLTSFEVHVWRVRVPAVGAEPAGWRALLTSDEQARVERKRMPADRQRELSSRAVQRLLLGAYLGVRPESVAFTTEQRGKPVLAGAVPGARLEFNLSHSGDWSLLAFARNHPVGADVERWRDLERDDLVRQFFAPAEQREWADIPPERRRAAFFAGWTRKEAYLKALGVGLMKPLDSFAVRLDPGAPAALLSCTEDPAAATRWRIDAFTPAEAYSAAVAVSSAVTTIRCFTFIG